MWFKNLFKSLTSTSSRRRPTSVRLCLEALERRDVLSYSLLDLGDIVVTDINNSAQVVGSKTINGNARAVLWREGATIDLGTLGGPWSSARGMNDVGQVVGLSTFGTDATAYRAFLLTPEDTNSDGAPDQWFRDTNADGANDLMRDLGTLGGSHALSFADDVNNLGQVVGSSSWEAPEEVRRHAFLWQNGVMTDLGTGGGLNSGAAAINDAGLVTGWIDFGAQGSDAFLWKNGTLTILDGLDGAADINDAGQIVGSQYLLAVRWTPAVPNGTTGTYAGLGALPTIEEDDVSYSFAAGMNNMGQVVGNSPSVGRGGGSIDRGFIYQNGGMTELPVTYAVAINDAGQIVGDRGGRGHLLTPVVPHTQISVSDASVVEGDSGTTNAVFTVSLSTPCTDPVTVNYYAAENTATVGDDFEATYGTLHFAPGQTSLTVIVPVIGDQISEPDESFSLNLNTPSMNATLGRAGGVGVIVNDDPPEIRIYDAAWQEGNTGTTGFTFHIELSVASSQPVTVTYSTAKETALPGSDYQERSGTLTFAAGETTKTITVPVLGDRLPESNETFFVNLSGPTNATIADGQGVGTILDDEPRISISDVMKAEGKKGKTTLFTFTVRLSAAYDQPVTMSFQTVNGTATSNGDYTAKSGTLTFAPGQTTKTISIKVHGDSTKETHETFYLDLFGLSNNAQFTKHRGIGTILNDD